MADKEEKILIKWIVVPCNGCSGAGENVCDNCYDWDMWQSSPTREQAVDKMANALFLKTNKGDNWADYKKIYPKNGYIDDAEAALNSLLEDKK